MKFIFAIAWAMMVSISCFAQSLSLLSKGDSLRLRSAILMNENNYVDAMVELEKAIKLQPKNIVYQYDMALANYHLRNYKKSIKILKRLTTHKKVTEEFFQLLGNCYDNLGQWEDAIKIYDKGLLKFPSSGSLYLEKGIVQFTIKNYDKAISLWEKGVEVNPSFPSNYYWLGKIFAVTKDKVWAFIYGEMFMNIERNTHRTVEMSRILFKVYNEAINQSIGSFGNEGFIGRQDVNHEYGIVNSFQSNFSDIMKSGVPKDQISSEDKVSLSAINNLRQNFINQWFEQNKNAEYPNILFDFLKVLMNKGYLECYNYWFLMMGEEDEFGFWYKKNRTKYLEFSNWFNKNPLFLDKSSFFVRNQY